jgi:hypothetical protein
MATYGLTRGNDTIVGTSGNDTLYATATTLNQLTGGGGTYTLALYNSGSFHVDQLASFTGFDCEEICAVETSTSDTSRRGGYIRTRLTNRTNTTASDAAHPGGHSSYRGNDQ